MPSAVDASDLANPIGNPVVEFFQPIPTVKFDVFVRRRILRLADHEFIYHSTRTSFAHAVSTCGVGKIRVNRPVVEFLNKALVKTVQCYL